MKKITVNDAVLATHGRYFGNPIFLTEKINGVVIDNRKVKTGFLFVPIKGGRFDGHAFIDSAYEAGAVCCFSSKKINTGKPYILVKDTVTAFQNLAEYYKSLLEVKTVGITGSVGKTTTKEMIASVLSTEYKTVYTEGNLNNQTGVPQVVFSICEEHEAAVIEMGTNHFGEIASVSKIVRPDYCVITNIGEAHIEFLKSQQGIFKAKTEMLKYMKSGGTVFINGDDRFLNSLKKKRTDVVSYGMNDENEITARNVECLGLFGSRFICDVAGFEYCIQVPAPGVHMIYNAMAGIAVGRAFGISMEKIIEGIENYAPLSGRMNVIQCGKITVIDDVYNANPDSMRAAIDVLCYAEGRKVCVIGDMFELGEESDKKHYDIGKYIAKRKIDLCVCIGEKMKNAADAIKNAGGKVLYFDSQNAFLSEIDLVINENDAILVKASRGMELEKTVSKLKEIFCDSI